MERDHPRTAGGVTLGVKVRGRGGDRIDGKGCWRGEEGNKALVMGGAGSNQNVSKKARVKPESGKVDRGAS